MKPSDFIKPEIKIVADVKAMQDDHEVQMAREQCYHIANNAIALHKMLQTVSENKGLDSWVSEKITLANDYCKTVKEYLEYELMTGGPTSVSEDASAGASSSVAIATAPAQPLFKKRKIIKRKMP
jgi:hypothetical protein